VSTLALADAHCHLWIAPAPEGSPRLADLGAALSELNAFAAAGGVAVLDCQPGGCGRDARVLHRLAEASGVAVFCSTGFHMERHYLPGEGPWADPAGAEDAFTRELREGAPEEPVVRPRIVKCAFTGADGREAELMRAALAAARAAGAAVVVHTERGQAAEQLPELVAAAAVDPGSVQVSHIDKRPDRELHRSLARAGLVLGFDTFARPRYDPEGRTWPLLLGLVEDGLAGHVTVGLDLADAGGWSVNGGPGLPLVASIAARLADAGVGEPDVAALVGGNAMRLVGSAQGAPL
jgi:phosphotriesterase-related protein